MSIRMSEVVSMLSVYLTLEHNISCSIKSFEEQLPVYCMQYACMYVNVACFYIANWTLIFMCFMYICVNINKPTNKYINK